MNFLKRFKYRNTTHHCFSCDWFKMTKSQNRYCKNPKKFTSKDWKNGVCLHWILAEDIEKRSLTIMGMVT